MQLTRINLVESRSFVVFALIKSVKSLFSMINPSVFRGVQQQINTATTETVNSNFQQSKPHMLPLKLIKTR